MRATTKDTYRQEWMRLSDAAKLIGTGRGLVASLIEEGQVPASKIGRRTILVHVPSLLAYIERRSSAPITNSNAGAGMAGAA
jgi:excisionase family DNA binding protein